jgi:small-conductance mechanosensitive channel
VGDFIECTGLKGTVEDIGLFQTRLVSPDNKVLIISNTNAINAAIINYSMKDTRRVDMTFSIAYEEDFRKAKNIIREEIAKTGLALPNPEPFVNIKEHNASSIDIEVRTWVKSDDYWDFYWALLEDIKMAFDKKGITIPYSQLDVHIKDKESEKLQLEDEDAYVQAEIAHYKHTLSDKAVARKRRLAAEAAEKERQENKNIVKAIIKKARKKDKKKVEEDTDKSKKV